MPELQPPGPLRRSSCHRGNRDRAPGCPGLDKTPATMAGNQGRKPREEADDGTIEEWGRDWRLACAAVLLAGRPCWRPAPVAPEEIVVSNYRRRPRTGHAVRGRHGQGLLSKEEGAVRHRHHLPRRGGGHDACATMLGGQPRPYAEGHAQRRHRRDPSRGADIKIVSDNVLTVAEFVWVREAGLRPIKTVPGPSRARRFGYNQPRARPARGLARPGAAVGPAPQRPRMPSWSRPGRLSAEGIAALDIDLVDANAGPPSRCGRNSSRSTGRSPRRAEMIAPISNVVGVAAGAGGGAPRAGFIRAIIRGRRPRPGRLHGRSIRTRPATSSPRPTSSRRRSPAGARPHNLVTSRTAGISLLGATGPDLPRRA